MQTVFSICAALAALVSAFFWVKAATDTVKVDPDQDRQEEIDTGWRSGRIIMDGANLGAAENVLATLRLQGQWNTKAAWAAGAAAVLQALSLIPWGAVR